MAKIKKFEDKMKELEDIIIKLESGELSLDDSIKVFHTGMKLSKELSVRLNEVECQIKELIKDEKNGVNEIKFKVGEEDEF